MLMWAAPCGRLDTLYAASVLASRAVTWTDACDTATRILVGYLLKTAKVRLTLDHNHRDTTEDLWWEIQTDADLRHPRSQSGLVMALGRKHGLYGYLQAISKKQSITTDGTPAAEVIAGHEGLKAAILIM